MPEPLEALHQRVAGAPVEGDALLDLGRGRRELEQHHVGLRMARAEHRHQVAARAVRALLEAVGELVELADRPLEVLLLDLVVGGRHWPSRPVPRAVRTSLTAPRPLLPPPLCISACPPAGGLRLAAAPPAAAPAAGLQQLQRLDVDQVALLADDVGVAHRLEELLGPVEVVDPDHHAAEALGDVAVGAGAGDDPVLGGEALGLLVERGQRDPRVEDLEDVDLLDDVEQVLVVGNRVQAVERVRHVDEPALARGSRRSSRPSSSRARSSAPGTGRSPRPARRSSPPRRRSP